MSVAAFGDSIMSNVAFKVQPGESLAEKMRRLREEAQASARAHTRVFLRILDELDAIAADISDGGEAYPVGVREAARQLSSDLEGARLNVTSIIERAA